MTAASSGVIKRLLQARHLEQITGGEANGESLLATARTRLDSASLINATDPESAFVLAYDSARLIATGLLAQCGLRPTTGGGHIAVGEATKALFGDRFDFFDQMRRLRHQLEYPRGPGTQEVQVAVVDTALSYTAELADTAEEALPKLRIWRPDR